jgi:transmembrane sensor
LKEHEEHIDERIAKYLAGEALPAEAIWLDEWKDLSEENLQYFNRAKTIFQFTLDQSIDTSAMYEKIIGRHKQSPKQFTLNRYFTPLRIAASLILLSFIGITAYLVIQNRYTGTDMVLASTGNMLEQQLADGSSVALNKHAKLTVTGNFNRKDRKVRLEGEAFFEVIHNEAKPFMIEAGGVLIQDIGTAFNVKAEPESDSVMVFVTEGIVEMSTPVQSLKVHKDQYAVFIKSTQQIVILTHAQNNAGAYKTKHFRFEATSLGEVVQTLNTIYGKTILIENDQISSCTISVEFYNESLDMMLTVIAETLGLTVEESNNTYILKGKSCTP